jgi:hypothetical protein
VTTPRGARPLLAALAAALLLPVVSGCAVLTDLTAGDPCVPQQAPPDASPSAVAYLAAVESAKPGWLAVSGRIGAQGMQAGAADLRDQVAVDEAFLADVRAIKFGPRVQPLADDLDDALVAYVDFVRTSAGQPGYLGEHRDVDVVVNEDRAEASSALREALHLPANGCVLNRP